MFPALQKSVIYQIRRADLKFSERRRLRQEDGNLTQWEVGPIVERNVGKQPSDVSGELDNAAQARFRRAEILLQQNADEKNRSNKLRE